MSDQSGWETVARSGMWYAWAALAGAAVTLLAAPCVVYIGGTATLQPVLRSVPADVFLLVGIAGLTYIATKFVVAGLYTPWAPALDGNFRLWAGRLVAIGGSAAWAYLVVSLVALFCSIDFARVSAARGPTSISYAAILLGIPTILRNFIGMMAAVLIMKSLLMISETSETREGSGA